MERDNQNKSLFIWIEEFWEEIEIQIYGITGAIFFFVVIYLIFQPLWMKYVFEIISKMKFFGG
tara:strand:+ start:1535 stop:1723 length:189 start_codon:yes stop_codon:yes gene_type:complete